MEVKLFPYQQTSVDEILNKFFEEKYKRVLYQLSTGGGKTFIFSFLIKEFIKRTGKKVVVLCHKEELVGQTATSLSSIGVTSESVTSDVKKLKHDSQVYIAMIETADRRLKKNNGFFQDVGLVIADECHILIFDKVFDYFKQAKILGCSATPVVDKKINFYRCKYCKTNYDMPSLCCGEDAREWIKPFTLSRIYETIVVGVTIKELIDMGRLVPEISFIKEYTDNSELSLGSDGDFTAESMDKAYSNSNAVFDCLLNYKELCEGKKTMIFNGTTTQNAMVYQRFKEEGYNVRMYDSVNSKKSERKDIVKWFEETPDAILCNVGCFTTGFDVSDVQAVILNRPTASLSLFLQIVGRGGRTTNKIYKPNFILIDGGGNIERFNEWSDNTRDWVEIFYNGILPEKEKRPKKDITDVQSCMECGFLMEKSVSVCPNCGEELKPKKKAVIENSDEVLKPIREIPPPDAKSIHEYTIRHGETLIFALKILAGQILDMFKFYRVNLELYEKANRSGELKRKVTKMLEKCYYYLVAMDDIKSERVPKISTIYNAIRDKLNKMYKNKK